MIEQFKEVSDFCNFDISDEIKVPIAICLLYTSPSPRDS